MFLLVIDTYCQTLRDDRDRHLLCHFRVCKGLGASCTTFMSDTGWWYVFVGHYSTSVVAYGTSSCTTSTSDVEGRV